jgi:hypothetical protein
VQTVVCHFSTTEGQFNLSHIATIGLSTATYIDPYLDILAPYLNFTSYALYGTRIYCNCLYFRATFCIVRGYFSLKNLRIVENSKEGATISQYGTT